MYQKYKSGGEVYGSYVDMPAILWQYFNILENELQRRESESNEQRAETQDTVNRIMKGKRG